MIRFKLFALILACILLSGCTPDPLAEEPSTAGRPPASDYIVNRSTRKFHTPACPSVEKISDANKTVFHGARELLLDMGYEACMICRP